MSTTFSTRKMFGVIIAIYSIWLSFKDVQAQHWFWLLLPILLAALAYWLLTVPPKVSPARQRLNERFQAYFAVDRRAKSLDMWARWLSWAAMPITAAYVYFAISTLQVSHMWALLLPMVLFFLPSSILHTFVAFGYYEYAKAKIASQRQE
jgi:uncharacterized membrane protein HdeD (DUF308 family)